MYKGARRLKEATKQSEAINSISVKHRTIVGFMGGATPLQLELAFPGQATRNSVGKKLDGTYKRCSDYKKPKSRKQGRGYW